MSVEIFPLFSVPLYLSNVDIDSNEVINYAKRCKYTSKIDKLHLSNETNLIEVIPGLKKSISEHVNNYFYNILQINNSFKYYFSDSWFVKINPGGITKSHIHSNSIYSGVYYCDMEYYNSIIFYQEKITTFFNTVIYDLEFKERNQYNGNRLGITPKNNTILLFPSSLKHEVSPNISNEDRYSFAFNIMPYNFKSNNVGARI